MSWPAMALYLPSRRNPVSRAMMRRGLSPCNSAGGRCSEVSRTPGRKGSIRMSVVGIRERSRVREEGSLRFRAMEVLCRVRRSGVGVGLGFGVSVWELAVGRSMRRTVAPWSARRRPQKGPGARPANSRTRRPVRGGGAVVDIVVADGWIVGW